MNWEDIVALSLALVGLSLIICWCIMLKRATK